MIETSARLLALLGLLQQRRDWSGRELSDKLGVTTRTVRNDVARLRTLGYPVDSTSGVGGRYRLGRGASLPPLLLDDDEAVAVTIALGAGAGADTTVTGLAETTVGALAKLELMLPAALRRRVEALQAAMVAIPGAGPGVDPAVLTSIASACRDAVELRFDYRAFDGSRSRRRTQPHWLVRGGRRWYLVAWDLDRDDWRTFRVDQLTPVVPTGAHFDRREPPEGDVAAHVRRGVATAGWLITAEILVFAPAGEVRRRLPFASRIEAVDDRSCRVRVGADSPALLAIWIGALDADFEVVGPPELLEVCRVLAARFARAAATAGVAQ